MKLKKITTFLACTFIFGAIASAQEFTLSDDGNTIKYEARVNPNECVTLIVTKGDTGLTNNSDIVALEYGYADENGEITFEFDMPHGDLINNTVGQYDGQYDVYLKKSDEDFDTSQIIMYAEYQSRLSVIDAFKAATSLDDVESILNDSNYVVSLKAIGCDMDSYSLFVDEIVSGVFAYSQEFAVADMEKIRRWVNSSIGIAGVNGSANDKYYMSLINPEFEDIKYNDIEDEIFKAWINTYFSTIGTVSGLSSVQKEYEKARALYVVNNSGVDEIENNLSKYAAKLDILSSAEYNRYVNLRSKYATNSVIVNKLSTAPATSGANLCNIIGVAVPVSGNAGGGASSSGRSSSSGGTSIMPPIVKEENIGTSIKTDDFPDMVNTPWATEAVKKLAEAGIIAGDEKGNFNPNNMIKREEFIKMLVLATNVYSSQAKTDFEDIAENAWYTTYVASAVSAGIVSGISETEFGVGMKLTRQDMAVLCARAVTDAEKLKAIRSDVVFADSEQISDYAKTAVNRLYMSGIINGMGDNKFCPQETATRAQCAVIIYNLFLK